MTNAVPPVVDFEWESYGLARLNSIPILSQRLQPRTSMSAHQWGNKFHGLILKLWHHCRVSRLKLPVAATLSPKTWSIRQSSTSDICRAVFYSTGLLEQKSKHRQCFEVGTRPPATPKQRFCLCRPKSSTIFTMNIFTRKTQVAHA